MAYEFTGGQTSVIFTDLLQGVLLLIAGLGLFLAGIIYLGGFEKFWDLLPASHRQSLPGFNDDPKFNFVGIFWQDGLAGGLAFYFMHQGMLLRFLSARSAGTARRAAGWVILVLMPLTAIAVAGAGWIGRAMVTTGKLDSDLEAKHAFIEVARVLCAPGMFGIVIAALLAALMSTADTLINASSSILVNDFYKPFLVKGRDDRHYLKAAHWMSLLAAVIGVALVPVFMQQKSIYEAHAMFTATITPPMAVAILFALLWPRYNSAGAMATLAGGIVLLFASLWYPVLIEPFSHGIDDSGGFKYIRACYGMAVSAALGIGVTLLTAPPDPEKIHGLTLWTCRQRASSEPSRRPGKVKSTVSTASTPTEETEEKVEADGLVPLALTAEQRATLVVVPGDVVFVDDARWWLGGLRSARCQVADEVAATPDLALPAAVMERNKWLPGVRVVLSRVD
jgi:SSS family solute:Na+ symporter